MRVSAKRTIGVLVSLISICGFIACSNASADDAWDVSVEGARSTLVQLADLSRRQMLQTEAAQKLLTGEMSELKIPSFGNLTDAPDKVVLTEKNRAVGRFQLSGENGQITDVYFYLLYDKMWKVGAVRLLALTGILEQAYVGLKARTNLTEEEAFFVANIKLTLAPDKELKMWFAEHRALLDKLAILLRDKKSVYVKPGDKQFPAAAEILKKLNLSSASKENDGNLEIVIGGITDNAVGFIYSRANNPPGISPSAYIWVEAVAPNWYLFRTT